MSEKVLADKNTISQPTTNTTAESSGFEKKSLYKSIKLHKGFYWSILIVLLLVAAFSRWEVTVTSDCILLPEKDQSLVASVQESGVLKEIKVKEGDWVARDAVLAICQDIDMEKQLLKLSADIKQSQGRLTTLENQYAEQQANVEQAKSYYQQRQHEATELVAEEEAIKKYKSTGELLSEYPPELLELNAQIQTKQSEEQIQLLEKNRYTFLFSQGLVSQLQVDESTSRYQITTLNRRAAEDRMRAGELTHRRKVKTATTEEKVTHENLQAALYKLKALETEMQSINSEISSSSNELTLLEKKKEALTIKAAQDGLVLGQDIEKKLGQYLERGSEFCRIANISELRAVVAVSEKEITQVRLGSNVRIRIRSLVDQVFNGTVSYIGTEATIKPENNLRVYNCEVKVKNVRELLRPGMSGVTRISLSYQPGYIILFRWLKGLVKLEYWVW
ncbi:MAG: HlyD family efflux transporter periplasmic adaptor subunit [Acidobacteria bacterium]|nr:HlyD family efflux transporter periplasmic adaptor subunit [Acidobacteriota bacterium]